MTSNRFFVPRTVPDRPFIDPAGDKHRDLNRAVRARSGERIWPFAEQGAECRAETAALCAAAAIMALWNR